MYKNRIEKLLFMMNEMNIDVAFVQKKENLRYLTGFTGSTAWLFLSLEEAFFAADYRYQEQLKIECPDIRVVSINENMPFDLFRKFRKGTTLGFEDDMLYGKKLDVLKMAHSQLDFKGLGGCIEKLRSVKDREELENIKKAVKITDDAFEYAMTIIKPGMSEKLAALEIEYFMKKNGADLHMAYDISLASGIRSQHAHGRPTDKTIEKGDTLLMDFGCMYRGYCSDFSRTIFIGEASKEQKKAYEAVFATQQYVFSFIKLGVMSGDLDRIALEFMDEKGYGEYYGKGLGHGVGLTVAEGPSLVNIPILFSSTPLEVGNVITIEPGVYIKGKFGIRIEDIVVVTENGYENITGASKNLIEI